MASDKYLLLLCTFSCLCCVICDLNLSEDSPCVTNGFNGTCASIFKCPSAALTYLFINAGFDAVHHDLPDLPDFCSFKNKDPVVCCTDCIIAKSEEFRNVAIGPMGGLRNKVGSVAYIKCLENFQRLPYPCHGVGNIGVSKEWSEKNKCHISGHGGALAVGGREAQRWEFPHSALIGYGSSIPAAQWLCGGSVISERFILTAAHCTSTRALGNISFAALGLLKRSDPTKYWKIYNIKRIIIHPEYKSPSKYHDIALLETETEINFGKDLLPACLDTLEHDKWSAEASGWGRLGHRNALADTLQVVYLTEFNESECASIYQPHRHLKNGYDHTTQMCYGRSDQIVDTCEGDSGGPLQTNEFKCLYTIVGVTSYGKDCGILGSAGMYTRVSHYVPWIESIVWPEEAEEERNKDNEWLNKLIQMTS